MRRNPFPVFFATGLSLFSSLFAGFDAPVSISDEGIRVRIAFTVSDSTDVTVDIMDSAGTVVRRLASGKLGSRPPAPLSAGSLSQTLYWDKQDDRGRPVYGAFRVRVGAGLTARFDRFYGNNPVHNLIGYIRGLACDTNGDLVTLTGGYRGENALIVYQRDGSYRRTLVPYPGDLPDAKLDGFGRIRLSDGRKVPLMYQGHHGTFVREFHFPWRQQMAVAPQGWVVMANTNGNGNWYGNVGNGRKALIIGMDGSCPLDSVFGPAFPPVSPGPEVFMAVTPAGDSLYMSGANRTTLYKGLLATRNAVQPFAAGFLTIKGIGTDPQGRVYACDSLGHSVKVFGPDGTLLDSMAVATPNLVQINRKNGAVYVLTVNEAQAFVKLIKYSAFPALDSLYAVTITWNNTTMRYDRAPVIALDDHAPNPVIWVGQTIYSDPNGLIQSYEDNGAAIVRRAVNIGKNAPEKWKGGTIYPPGLITVSPDEKLMYAGSRNWSRVDLVTGAVTASTITGSEVVFAPDGSLYASSVKNYYDPTFWHYDKNGVRLPMPNGAMEWVGPTQYCWGPDYGTRGFVVTRNRFYLMHAHGDPRGPNWQDMAPDGVNNNYLSIYDSALNLIDSNRLNGPSTMSGIQLDRAGNIYTTLNVRPKGYTYPDAGMSALLPNPLALTGTAIRYWAPYAAKNYYLFLYGSLLKFPPTGGVMGFTAGTVDTLHSATPDGAVPALQTSGFYDRVISVQGAVWQQMGVSLTPVQLFGRGDPYCICFTSRFSVDDNGRIFYPDAFRSQVVVLDNNRNEILRFGAYGNADQLGEGSARPNPAIPFAYPVAIQRINNSVYVSDPGARRVMRLKLSYRDSSVAGGNLSVDRAAGSGRRAAEVRVYPTPFNPEVNIDIQTAVKSDIRLAIYTVDGTRVFGRSISNASQGRHHLQWDGRLAGGKEAASGTYLIKVEAQGRISWTRSLLLK